MADYITTNQSLLDFKVCTAAELSNKYIPGGPNDPDWLAEWQSYHASAWQHHLLPWIQRRGREESDLSSTANLKHAAAVKTFMLVLETRGQSFMQGGADRERHKALEKQYVQLLNAVDLTTGSDVSVPAARGRVSLWNGG